MIHLHDFWQRSQSTSFTYYVIKHNNMDDWCRCEISIFYYITNTNY